MPEPSIQEGGPDLNLLELQEEEKEDLTVAGRQENTQLPQIDSEVRKGKVEQDFRRTIYVVGEEKEQGETMVC